MRISLSLLFLLLFTTMPVPANTENRTNKPRSTSITLAAYWPVNSVVKVYFVRDQFLPQEKQIIRETIEAWHLDSRSKGVDVPFVFEGETSGLIDCLACLTITRQEVYTSNSQHRASFNRLRFDERGRLFSAWIGIDRGVNRSQVLKDSILKALDRGLGV